MRIKIATSAGSQSDGIVLSSRGSIIRVAIPGCNDAAEFSRCAAHWFSEDGEPVKLQFLAGENSDRDFGSAWNGRISNSCLDPHSWNTQSPTCVN
jgi:hypothetical protein